MNDSVQLVCNLTGAKSTVKSDTKSYQDKLKQFGSEDNLKKYYVQSKIAKELANGKQLSSIAESFGFALDESKEEYYKELVKYYKKGGLVQLETKINFLQTDDDVRDFMSRLSKAISA